MGFYENYQREERENIRENFKFGFFYLKSSRFLNTINLITVCCTSYIVGYILVPGVWFMVIIISIFVCICSSILTYYTTIGTYIIKHSRVRLLSNSCSLMFHWFSKVNIILHIFRHLAQNNRNLKFDDHKQYDIP